MHRAWSLVLVFAATLPAQALAQWLEVGPSLGYAIPVRDQFARGVIIPSTSGFSSVHLRAKHAGGPVAGIAGTVWATRHFGFELASSFWSTTRTIYYSSVPPLTAWSDPRHTTLASVALRAVLRLGDPNRAHFEAAVGPQWLHLAGEDSVPEPFGPGALQKPSLWGGTAGARLIWPITRSLAVRAALDASFYRVRLVPLPPGDTTTTPLQVDLTPSVGVVLRVR